MQSTVEEERTLKGHSLMDSCTWMCQCCPTSNKLHQFCMDTGCCQEDPPKAMDDRDGYCEKESGNSILSMQLDNDDNDDNDQTQNIP